MQSILPQFLFYMFATIVIVSSVALIFQNNPVKSVLLLVLAFIASAVLWLLLQAEFLALILILVYVGAVMTLFLFVVMMLNIDIEMLKQSLKRYIPLAILVVSMIVGFLWQVMPNEWLHAFAIIVPPVKLGLSNTEQIGNVLYTEYALPFEVSAIILLVAMIAAVTLVHRQRGRSKHQNIVKQIMTKKQDRLSLVLESSATTCISKETK